MTAHVVRIVGRREVAEGTLALQLERPPGFEYKAGQAVDLTLIDPPETDAKGSRRAFSLVSAPYEKELAVATRVRDSAFKRVLKAAPPGSELQLEGPFGSLTLHGKRSRPAVFIAGGIGITPFMSILRQASKDGLEQQLVLVYSNRRPEDAAFLPELEQMARRRNVRLVATMTEMEKSAAPWEGRRGMIDEALLRSVADGQSTAVYYVAGPPSMNQAIRRTLNAIGVEDDDIRSEDFSGY